MVKAYLNVISPFKDTATIKSFHLSFVSILLYHNNILEWIIFVSNQERQHWLLILKNIPINASLRKIKVKSRDPRTKTGWSRTERFGPKTEKMVVRKISGPD